MSSTEWSKREKEIARNAFKVAYNREQQAILEDIRRRTSEVSDLAELWRLQEYLTEKRIEIGEKCDYRYSVLDFVFAQLIWEGWLQEEDLKGLADEKLDEIRQNTLFLKGGDQSLSA